MAKFPTYEEMSKKVANKALDEYLYNGKSIREWIQIIASEDAISRQAVVSYLCTHCPDDAECYEDCDEIKNIKTLPPITSQAKVGHWIDADGDNAICGCCNRLNHLYGTYCKHCGAKMKESEG